MTNAETRREARESVRSPGKFEGESPMVPILWDLSLEGGADEETVDGPFGRWYGLVGRWIINSDSQGFVTGDRFPTRDAARSAFESIADSFETEE